MADSTKPVEMVSPCRDIAHRNEPKAARLAGFAIHNQFDFSNSAERLKEFPQCAFCHVKGKISDVKLHNDGDLIPIVSYRAVPECALQTGAIHTHIRPVL